MKYETIINIFGKKFRVYIPAENYNEVKTKAINLCFQNSKMLKVIKSQNIIDKTEILKNIKLEIKEPIIGDENIFEQLKKIMKIK